MNPSFLRRCVAVVASMIMLGNGLFAREIDMVHEIVPIIKEHCAKCHLEENRKGGLSLNNRAGWLSGSENGPIVVPGDPDHSRMLAALISDDPDVRMPPKGNRVPPEKVALIRAWIQQGMKWEPGFSFADEGYEPPLLPRRPDLPSPSSPERAHPIDRVIDAYYVRTKQTPPPSISDDAFLRRAHLDIIGLLPTPEERTAFSADTRPTKRAELVSSLLSRDVDYAEHWLTFWNDLLRNDYGGTGFITGGRRQITAWLYDALVSNKPFDQFTHELIAPPSDASRGFIDGIKWRGEASAGQTVEIQFSQSVAQSFLGINMKCASCHDSFVDRWKLDEAFALAAIYSERPLEIHRCDVPTGRKAVAGWIFPELGQVDPKAPRNERLKQLAALMTHPENGRFSRTFANRIWHRLMGHGIVHPVDSMQTAPWSEDLLDLLAITFQDRAYDIRSLIEFIASSHAYQARAEIMEEGAETGDYVFRGPRARRMTAEQFVDAVWQITQTAPEKFDAPVMRGGNATQPFTLEGSWIWTPASGPHGIVPANEKITFRLLFDVGPSPKGGFAALTVDNEYTLYLNGRKLKEDKNWETVETVSLPVKAGQNEILVVAVNAGSVPNAAALYFQGVALRNDGESQVLASGAHWEFTTAVPNNKGKFSAEPEWAAASVVTGPWGDRVGKDIGLALARASDADNRMVRASLLKSDFLTRSLGRPNREQIVSMRPNDLSTLEAIDLSNGPVLSGMLERGARHLMEREWDSPAQLATWVFGFAHSRAPTPHESEALLEMLGSTPSQSSVSDMMWAVMMLPEFITIR